MNILLLFKTFFVPPFFVWFIALLSITRTAPVPSWNFWFWSRETKRWNMEYVVCVISDSCFWVKICVSRLHSQQMPTTRDTPEVWVQKCVCESTVLQTFTLVHLSLHEPLFKSVGSVLVQKLWLLCSCVCCCVFLCQQKAWEPGRSPEKKKNSERMEWWINEGRSDEKKEEKKEMLMPTGQW